jgi:hypothetical protein
METWIRCIFLVLCYFTLSAGAQAQEEQEQQQDKPQSVIKPTLERRDINEANIDSENFELGLLVGVISIEDFSSDTLLGVRAAYHVNEDFFIEATYGQAQYSAVVHHF